MLLANGLPPAFVCPSCDSRPDTSTDWIVAAYPLVLVLNRCIPVIVQVGCAYPALGRASATNPSEYAQLAVIWLCL